MEFDVNLVKLQGTLYSFRMQGFLNNPDATPKVIEGLQEITENLPEDAKAKITYFMVLRTEFSALDKFKNDELIGHYLSTEPDFKKEYLITYVYHLNLQIELFKVIENTPAELGLELLRIIIKKIKDPLFHLDKFGHEHLFQLWKSVFVKICKIDTGLQNCEKYKEFINLFKELSDLLKNILIVLITSEKYDKLAGSNLYNFFKSVLVFINLHISPDVSDDPLYKFDSCDNQIPSQPNMHMVECINDIFSKIPNIMMNLTVDMWMDFSEVYLDFDKQNSVQLLIGDLVYQILKEVNQYNVSSEVLNMLSSISINKFEVMSKADINDIIYYIEKGEVSWFPVLVRHSKFLEKKCLECLINNLEFASTEDLEVILNTSYDCVNNGKHDNLKLVKTLFIKALKKTSKYGKWFEKVFEKYQPNLLTTAKTQEELTETFNKISIEKEFSDCNLISLCIQAPIDTIKKVCSFSIYGSEQTKFVINILKILDPACRVPVHKNFRLLDHVILKSQIDEVTDKEKELFINLVVDLAEECLLGKHFFNNLMETLKEYLENELFEKAVICLDLMHVLLKRDLFRCDDAVFLVFMSHILDHFSWDSNTFLLMKTEGRDLAISIIALIINRLEKNSFALDWAREEILKSWEVNQAVFCDVWFKFSYNWSGSRMFHSCILALAHSEQKTEELKEFLINCNKPSGLRASIILSLSMLLPVVTFREWNLFFENLLTIWKDIKSEDVHGCILDQFGSALQLAVLKEREMVPTCYEYCLRNFGKMAKQHSGKMTGESLVRSFGMIFILVGMIEEEERRKRCWEMFTPVLMQFVDRLKEEKLHRKEVVELLPLLDLKDVAEALLNKLQ